MMRVLVLTNLFPNPLQPDRAPFNRQQIAALAAAHDVRVIAPMSWTQEWKSRRGGAGRAQLPGDRRIVRDGMVVDHPPYVFTPKVMRGMYGKFLVASIRGTFERVLIEHRPEIVLGCWAYPDGWAAVHLAREAGVPVVIKVQGSDVLRVGTSGARFRRTCEALRGADAVVAVSRHLGERVVSMGVPTSSVHVVYNGVDSSRFCPGSRDAARKALGIEGDEPLITFVGNLVEVKGVDVLIRALGTVRQRGVRFRGAIVGDGPLRGSLERLIESCGLRDCVRLIGSCPLERVPLWHQATDLLVVPSRSEGIPNVIREAQACGTPFLASDVGGVAEVASAEALVPPDDVAALAERIGQVLDRDKACVGTWAGGVATCASTWEESARELGEVLERTIAESEYRVRRAG
jgi:glycosyltransferase involved in cell wall biosynthesis